MVDAQVPLDHELLKVAEAQAEPEIPPDAHDDDLSFEMASLEQRRAVPSHPAQAYQTKLDRVCNTTAHGTCVPHLDGRGQFRGTALQYLGDVFTRMLGAGEEKRNAPAFSCRNDAAGEHTSILQRRTTCWNACAARIAAIQNT